MRLLEAYIVVVLKDQMQLLDVSLTRVRRSAPPDPASAGHQLQQFHDSTVLGHTLVGDISEMKGICRIEVLTSTSSVGMLATLSLSYLEGRTSIPSLSG